MSSVIKQLMIYTNHDHDQGATVGTLLTIPAQFLVGRAMSANNKVILECEDRSSLINDHHDKGGVYNCR